MVCALTQPAFSAVRLYFTSSASAAGLTDSSLAFKDTNGNGTDFSEYRLKEAAPEVGVPTVDPTQGEYLYLWARFEDEPGGAKIQGIHLSVDDYAVELGRGVYLGDDSNDSGERRWHALAHGRPDGARGDPRKRNPQPFERRFSVPRQ
jgi:hypothetical protein